MGRGRSQATRPSVLRLVLCGPSLPADSLGGNTRTGQQGRGPQRREGVALAGQLAEVRAQGRPTGDSSPAGRQSGSLTTSGPRSSQALRAPKGGERKPCLACCQEAFINSQQVYCQSFLFSLLGILISCFSKPLFIWPSQ